MGNFFSDIGPITWFVLCWLSIYFIINIWVFIWRFFKLNNALNIEKKALDLLSADSFPSEDSTFYKIMNSNKHVSLELLNIYKIQSITKLTAGLSFLSIISSTAPFIGLFGTVVEILDAFYHLSGDGKISFDVIAPIISKALVATAFGILTAIPAYSFYIILKRRAFEVGTYLDMQINLILDVGKNINKKISLG